MKAAATLVNRIRTGMEATSAGERASEHIGALARNGRTVREWLSAVRRTAEAAGSYRSGWMDGRDLVAVVGDSRADPEQRVAAAAALSALITTSDLGRGAR